MDEEVGTMTFEVGDIINPQVGFYYLVNQIDENKDIVHLIYLNYDEDWRGPDLLSYSLDSVKKGWSNWRYINEQV
jgi:uncharacterized protein YkvS